MRLIWQCGLYNNFESDFAGCGLDTTPLIFQKLRYMYKGPCRNSGRTITEKENEPKNYVHMHIRNQKLFIKFSHK